MKFLLAIIALFTIKSVSSAQGIQFFEGTWKEALDKANKEDKLLFVDAFAQWCGPCKAMAKNVFTKQEVGDFFNKNFINLKLDMESTDGRSFESKYTVSAYPTLFFIDGKGKIIKKLVGAQQAEALINHGKDAIKNNDTSIDLAKLYEEGNREIGFMTKYVKALNVAGKPSMKIANDYLNSNPNITESEKLLFIFEAASEADSKLFEEMTNHKNKIIGLVGKEAFEEKIKIACKATVNKSVEFETKELLDEAISKANNLLADPAQFQYTSLMYYHQSFNQKEEYIKAAESLASKVGKKDEKTLKYVIEDMCKNYKDDAKVIEKAVDYAEDLYAMNGSFDNLFIYCKLLSDHDELDKAIKIAEAKIEDAKKTESPDVRQYEGLINFLKSKKG